ncbi:MAG: TPM domain-containing protein, partial [Bacteroidota bacterium]
MTTHRPRERARVAALIFAVACLAAAPIASTVTAATAALGESAPNTGPREVPVPPPPTTWVTDRAGVLAPATVAALEARLRDHSAATGHQVLVYVDRTTGGVPIEDWAVRAFERWRVGRKGIDDGVALFLFTGDRKVRIEVGYGLEGQLPDARASRIVREQIVPRMRAGD